MVHLTGSSAKTVPPRGNLYRPRAAFVEKEHPLARSVISSYHAAVNVLRVGTRGSDLALRQTRWVCARLTQAHADLRIEEVVIKTHGDLSTGQLFDKDWPAGGFVGAIEETLLRGDIDFAVHSYKDLPTDATPGLVIAAVPQREVPHDVLITREPADLSALPPGLRIGTSSPRRAAQIRRRAPVSVLPIRGNVPTRIAKMNEGQFDGVILAAAGLARLGLSPPNNIDLPLHEFVPAPAQGALAVQVRESSKAAGFVSVIEDDCARLATDAERAFLSATGAGCHVPVAAYATVSGARSIDLLAQLFTEDGSRVAQGRATGQDPARLGAELAARLRSELV